jgi:hypothetical protein
MVLNGERARPSVARTTLQWDLLASVLAAPLTLAAIILDWPVLREALALGFVFLVPGYLLVLALFPARGPRTIAGAPQDAASTPPLAAVERLGMSVLASLVILALVGILVAVTGDGLTEPRTLGAMVTVFLLLFGIAAVRTADRPRPDPADVAAGPAPRARVRWGTLLPAVLVLVASAGVLAVVVAQERAPDPGPQLFLLGHKGRLACYPENYNGTAYVVSSGERSLGCPRAAGNLTIGLRLVTRPEGAYRIDASWARTEFFPDGSEDVLEEEPLREWEIDAADFQALPDGDWLFQESFTLPAPPFEGTLRLSFDLTDDQGGRPTQPVALLIRSLATAPP